MEGQWKCLTCNATKGVSNGMCPTCGPTQTTPLDEKAKEVGGFYEAEAEKKAKEEAENKPEIESTATDGPTR